MIRTIIAIGLFLLSAVLSLWLSRDSYQDINAGVFFAGSVFTLSTIILFPALRINLNAENLVIYFLLMNAAYLVLLIGSLMTVWFIYVTGPLFTGYGAILTFKLVNKFIRKIKYSQIRIFLLGAVSFLPIGLLSIEQVATVIKPIYDISEGDLKIFYSVLFVWQILIGLQLHITLTKQPPGNEG